MGRRMHAKSVREEEKVVSSLVTCLAVAVVAKQQVEKDRKAGVHDWMSLKGWAADLEGGG